MRSWVVARCDPYKDPIPPIPADIVLQTAGVYIEAFETLTAQRFQPPDGATPVLARIRRSLASYLK